MAEDEFADSDGHLARGLWLLTPPVGSLAALAGEDRAQGVFAEFKQHEEPCKA